MTVGKSAFEVSHNQSEIQSQVGRLFLLEILLALSAVGGRWVGGRKRGACR